MQLSEHFTYEEAIESQTAARLGIDNVPADEIVGNMKLAAVELEKIRTVLNEQSIVISSWYRCPALNQAIGGSPTSSHTTGWAIDFNCRDFGTLVDVVTAVANCDVPFDQVIFEYDSWCHVSFAPALRGQVLTIRRGTGYMTGIILP